MRSGLPAELFDPFMQQVKRIVNHPKSAAVGLALQPAALVCACIILSSAIFDWFLVTLRHPRQVQAFFA